MKTFASSGYSFTPGSSTLDLSGIAGLTISNLLAVLNSKTGQTVYQAATPGYGYSNLSGKVLTLQAPLTGMSGTDSLTVIYDDGRSQSAIHDDGSSEGVVRTKLTQGELIRVPFLKNEVNLNFLGTSQAVAGPGAEGYDISGGIYEVTLVAAPFAGSAQGAWADFYFAGRALGLSFVRYSGAGPFDVLVDGIAYSIDDVVWQVPGKVTTLDDPTVWIVADDLPDGMHRCSVMVSADPTGVVSNRLRLLGFLAEKRAGYGEMPKLQGVKTGSVTTSSAVISNALSVGFLRSLGHVDYTNTSGATVNVTVTFGGATVAKVPVPAGATVTFDAKDQTVWDGGTGTFAHLADATGVTFAAYGKS